MAFSLTNFNPRQKQVVTHLNGPLLVISGAGTGKTHVLTGRILNLIEQGIPANSILALTFNEKAAQEMIERVDMALPLGHPEVSIHTFHAFCERILRECGFDIGITNDYKILQSADLWMVLKRHITDFKLNYFHSLGNPQKFFMEFTQYVSRLQDEDISPEAYMSYAQQIKKDASTEEERELSERHLELARSYETYEKILLSNGYLDFSGLLYYTLRLLEKRPSIRKEFQERFQYILVDEFQDMNFAQNKIVNLLAQEHKNLCVVGDDDQSIYKWRGASLTNILYFRKKFPEALTVVLNKNFRSTQAILDTAYASIQHNNPERLEVTESVDKKLIAATKTVGETPELYHFSDLADEVAFIITKANGFLRKGLNVAILVRTNALAKPFIEALKSKKIPYQHFSSSDVWNRHAIKDCMAVLRVFADPWDDIALFRCASLPFWEIPMEALLETMKKAKQGNSSLFHLMNKEPFLKMKKLIDELIEYSRSHSTGEVLGKFLHDSGYIEKASHEDPASVEDIAAFSEKVAAFENTHPNTKIADFLLYAQILEESSEGNLAGPFLDPSAIKILTIHAAKGLEFDAVFIPGLAQNKFPGINRKDPFEVPAVLIPESIPSGDHHIQEERRLFYVALTRAKSHLILSYSDFYDGKRQWKPSLFVVELMKTGKLSERNVTKRGTKGRNQLELLPIEDGNKKILMISKLSYSQLDTFSLCPLKYQFRYLFEIPTPPSPHTSFGISIHNTLKAFYEALKHDPTMPHGNAVELMTKIYEESWIAFGYENRTVQEDQKKRGLKMVLDFYEKERKDLVIPAFIEEPFSLNVGGFTLSGRIDRIDKLSDGTYEVIDYKTGKVEKNLKNNLQLSLYALACRDSLKIPVSKLSLYSIPDLEKVSTTRSEKELEACEEEVRALASELVHSDFSPTPGFHCRFCEYRLICPAAM